MTTDHSTENHLSKDELLDILNEIDAEQQNNSSGTADHLNENPTNQSYPDPHNQFR